MLNTRTLRFVFLYIISIFILSHIAFPDKIILDNGNSIEGVITSEDEDTVTIKIEGGSTDIPRDMIQEIKHKKVDQTKFFSPEEIYLRQRNDLRSTKKYDELFTAAQQALKQGLVSKHAIEDLEWLSILENKEVASKADQLLATLLRNYPIVVFGFKNETLNVEIDGLARGLSEMVSADLQKLGHLKIYERKRLKELLEEINFGASGYIDPKTAARHGKIEGAKLAILGEITKVADQLNIGVRIINVETSKVLYSTNVNGSENKIFSLEKELVSDLINKGFNMQMDERKEVVSVEEKENINNAEAVKLFGRSLYLYESGKPDEAKEIVKSAVDIVPDFNLASDLLNEISQELNKARILKDQSIKNIIEEKLVSVKESEKKSSCYEKSHAWYDLGWVQLQNNLAEDAARSFTNSINWDEGVQLYILRQSAKQGYVGIRLHDPSIEDEIGEIEWVDPKGPAGKIGIQGVYEDYHKGELANSIAGLKKDINIKDKLVKFNGQIVKNSIELEREISKLTIGNEVSMEVLRKFDYDKQTLNKFSIKIASVPLSEISVNSSNSTADLAFLNLFECLYFLKKYNDIISWGKIYLKYFSTYSTFKGGLTIYLKAAIEADNSSNEDKGVGLNFRTSLDELVVGEVKGESLKDVILENSRILAVNGKSVRNYLDFKRIIRAYKIGEKVKITIDKGEGEKDVEVEVVRNPNPVYRELNDISWIRLELN